MGKKEHEEAARLLREALEAVQAALDAHGRLAGVGRDQDRWRVRARAPKGKDGRCWQLLYRPPEGKPYQRSAQTEDEAEARALAEGEERRLRGLALGFGEVARLYLAWRQEGGHKASTLRRYRQALDRVAEALGRLEASRESVLAAQDALRAELHPNTVNLYLGMAGTAWAWALERGLVDRPWPAPRKLRVPRTAKRPLTAEESERLLGVLEAYEGGRYHALFALIVETGCRAGEACALEGRDVDLELGEVRFRLTKTDVDRSVPVSQALLAALPRVDPQEPLWRGRITGRAMNSCNLYSIWKRVRVLAGLGDEAVDVHSLRRSWITDAHRAGVPLAESMRVTGHRSPRVHLGYTANAPTSRTREAAAAVRAWRAGLPPQVPPNGGGDRVEHSDTEGDTGLTRRGCSQASLRKAMQHYDFRNLTPPQRKRLASLIDAVAGQGEREAAALLAVAECAELRASLLELAQQDR